MKLKKTNARVQYQYSPRGSQKCGICTMFREPNGCTAVEGHIFARGWCKLYKRSGARVREEKLSGVEL